MGIDKGTNRWAETRCGVCFAGSGGIGLLLQMLTEVGLNPFNAPPTAQGSDTQLGTRTRSGGLGLGLGLGSTPSGALNLGGTPMSMDMTEVSV